MPVSTYISPGLQEYKKVIFKSRFFKSHEITKFSHTYDYIDSNFDQVNPYFSEPARNHSYLLLKKVRIRT